MIIRFGKSMLAMKRESEMESILAGVGALIFGAIALWGALWKNKANRRQAELDAIHRESAAHAERLARNLEEVRRQAANEKPIDPNNRDAFL